MADGIFDSLFPNHSNSCPRVSMTLYVNDLQACHLPGFATFSCCPGSPFAVLDNGPWRSMLRILDVLV